MKEKRGCAAAVMHNDRLHVFGGYSGSSSLQTTETINVDGEVSYGPDLPTAVRVHAMTKINGTVSLLSGGITDTNSYSAKTWYYNHDTETFTSGPDLLEGRRTHGSWRMQWWRCCWGYPWRLMTEHQSPVMMDSTEMLINGQWQTGTIQCRKQELFWFPLVLYLSNMKALLFSFIFFSFLLTLGPPLPKAIGGFSMLEMHGDTYVIGG